MGIHWAAGKTRWTAHQSGGVVYDLAHLHPFIININLDAYKGLPAKAVNVHIGFSSHVFTRTLESYDAPDCRYADDRDPRAFCLDRYNYSLRLPGVIRDLCNGNIKCYYGKTNNYFVITAADTPDIEYRVFFDLQKWPQAGADCVLLVVQSAYADQFERAPHGRRLKPVGFKVLLGHALRATRPIAPP